jgi:hypothetical protein
MPRGPRINHHYIAADFEEWDDEPDELHVVPEEDIMSHKEHYRCPCQPKKFISIYNATEIWIHNKLSEGLN